MKLTGQVAQRAAQHIGGAVARERGGADRLARAGQTGAVDYRAGQGRSDHDDVGLILSDGGERRKQG